MVVLEVFCCPDYSQQFKFIGRTLHFMGVQNCRSEDVSYSSLHCPMIKSEPSPLWDASVFNLEGLFTSKWLFSVIMIVCVLGLQKHRLGNRSNDMLSSCLKVDIKEHTR